MKLLPSKIETKIDDKKRVYIDLEDNKEYYVPRIADLIIIDRINEIIDYLKERDK